MYDVATKSVAATPSSTGEDAGNVKTANLIADERNDYTADSLCGVIGPSNEFATLAGAGATDSEGGCSQCVVGGNGIHVLRSPVMLEFGAELPGHAASSSGRALQFPIPNGWDDPEVKTKTTCPAVFEIISAVETEY